MTLPVLPPHADPAKLRRDLRTLAVFVQTWCDGQHHESEKSPLVLKGYEVTAIAGRPIRLCPDCRKLLAHALVKRTRCPMHPKPWCKHCPTHCYHSTYRDQIRAVMRYAGLRLLLRGRVDYLLHFLF